MIPGHPEETLKPLRQQPQGKVQVVFGMPKIATQNQPILRMRRQRLERFPVDGIVQMEITNGIELHAILSMSSSNTAGATAVLGRIWPQRSLGQDTVLAATNAPLLPDPL